MPLVTNWYPLGPRDVGGDQLGQLRLGDDGRAVVQPSLDLVPHGGEHGGVAVAQDVGAVPEDAVDVAVAIDVEEAGALSPIDVEGIGQ